MGVKKKTAATRGRPLAWIVCLAAVFIVNVLSMPKAYYPGDPLAVREETRAILLTGGLAIPDEVAKLWGTNGQFLVLNGRTNHYYSKYGVMNAIMALPPMLLERVVEGRLPPVESPNRALYLTLWNLVLALVIAHFLYRIAGFYTDSEWIMCVFVWLDFYTGFLWHYLRAQTTEIVQVLFFVTFMYSLLSLKRCWGDAQTKRAATTFFWCAWASVLAMTLTKISYILLGPLFVLAYGWMLQLEAPRAYAKLAVDTVKANLIPGGLVIAVLLLFNFLKFGSPFLTGYHQWRPEIHSFNGDLSESLYGFFFAGQWSFLIHFPMVAVALIGWHRYWREQFFDAVCALTVFVVYLIMIGSLPSWRGEMCYGPRYLLFMLPLLSVPAVYVLETLSGGFGRIGMKLATTAIALPLAYSCFLQTQVNRFDFMAFYAARDPLTAANLDILSAIYWVNTSYGKVNWDFARADGDVEKVSFWPEFKKRFPDQAVQGYKDSMRKVFHTSNYYWF